MDHAGKLFIGMLTDAASLASSLRPAEPKTFTTVHGPAMAASLALLALYAFGYLIALLRGEFYRSEFFGQALHWNDPRSIYACIVIYFIMAFCALICALRYQGINMLLFLCPMLAVDAMARQLHTPLVPAVHFLVVIGFCSLPFVRRMLQLPPVLTIFVVQVFFYVVSLLLRGNYQLANSDLMMLSFGLVLCLFYALTDQPGSSKWVWLHLGVCVIVAALPDLVFFLKEVQFSFQSARLSPLNISEGANTHGVLLSIAGFGCLLYYGRFVNRTLLGAVFLLAGAMVVFGGSRWQIVAWLLAAWVVLNWRMRLAFLVVVVSGFLGLTAYYGEFEFFVRLFTRFDDAIFNRATINSVGLEVFRSEWMLGVGAGGWFQLSQSIIGRSMPVHNVLLAEFVYSGLVVGMLNVVFHFSLVFIGFKAYFSGTREARIATGAMLVFVVSQQSVFYWHYGVFAALALALRVAEQAQSRDGSPGLLKNWLRRFKPKNL